MSENELCHQQPELTSSLLQVPLFHQSRPEHRRRSGEPDSDEFGETRGQGVVRPERYDHHCDVNGGRRTAVGGAPPPSHGGDTEQAFLPERDSVGEAVRGGDRWGL